MCAASRAVVFLSLFVASAFAQDVDAFEERELRHLEREFRQELASQRPAVSLASARQSLPGQASRELRQKQVVAKEMRGQLESSVTDAVQHMSDVAKIKHARAKKQAQLRNSKSKRNILQSKMRQMEHTHARLVDSLHRDIDPKLDQARDRLKKKQDVYQNEAAATQFWEDQERKARVEANEMIQDEKAARDRLSELKAQVGWAQRQEELAEKQFVYDKQMAKEEVQSLKYAEDQYKSELLRVKKAKEATQMKAERTGHENNELAMEELEDARRDLAADEDEAHDWKENVDNIRAKTVDMLKENATSHDSVLEMQAQLNFTKQQEALAVNEYKLKHAMVAQGLQTLAHAKNKHMAEAAKLRAAGKSAKASEESVRKLGAIRDMQQQEVENSIARREGKLQNEMKKWELARDSASHEIKSLESDYADWQGGQQQRAKRIAQAAAATAEASKMFADGMREAVDKRQTKVAQDAVAASKIDWGDDWARSDNDGEVFPA